ncbi:MAG: 50S ribosomal protein L6 [Patescibacteria group bacterium]
MVGKKPIKLPEGVNIAVTDQAVEAAGPLGRFSVNLPAGVKVSVEGADVRVTKSDLVPPRIFGLGFALVRNAIEGVSQGFSKELELVGVGYRAEKTASGLKMTLGFSHPVEFLIPAGVVVEVADSTKIKLSGIDLALVTQTAAQIRKLRPPEPYKGKGIRYANEIVRRKQGKVVKAAGGAA